MGGEGAVEEKAVFSSWQVGGGGGRHIQYTQQSVHLTLSKGMGMASIASNEEVKGTVSQDLEKI